jgi:hypothetical protein
MKDEADRLPQSGLTPDSSIDSIKSQIIHLLSNYYVHC